MKLSALVGLPLFLGIAVASPLPARVGQCKKSYVTAIGQRLIDGKTGQPIAGSGSEISFANGLSQVSYGDVPAVDASQVNDPVINCLVKLPKNCPPGDDRGKIYATIDLRTMLIWALPDSEHACGGA